MCSMATPEYYRKQIELLLDWADTVTNAELQISLTRRALDFLPLANWTDDQTLQRLQEKLDKIAMPTLKP